MKSFGKTTSAAVLLAAFGSFAGASTLALAVLLNPPVVPAATVPSTTNVIWLAAGSTAVPAMSPLPEALGQVAPAVAAQLQVGDR